MTQDEVDLIYNYLHENYRYEDGLLIRKIKSRTQPIGKKIGCFSYTDGRNPKTMVTLNFSKNRFCLLLPNLIWLFHNKEYPFCMHYKDNNPLNYKIENMLKGSKDTIKKNKKVSNPFKIENGNYKAFIRFNYKTYHLGVYEEEHDARNAYDIAKINLITNNSFSAKQLREIIKKTIGDKTTASKNQKLIKGYTKRWNRYWVCISVNNKKIHIGGFGSPEEAHAAYLKAKEEMNVNK